MPVATSARLAGHVKSAELRTTTFSTAVQTGSHGRHYSLLTVSPLSLPAASGPSSRSRLAFSAWRIAS